MKFVDALGNIKYGKTVFFGNNVQMSEQADGIVTINAAILSGTGSSIALLGDVVISSIQDDQFLRYSTGSVKWVNQFITAADVGAGTFKAGTFVFPGIVNITSLLSVSGTALLNGNVAVAGTLNVANTSQLGVCLSQVGTSFTISKVPNILFLDTLTHNYSGTTESSFVTYTLLSGALIPNSLLKVRGKLQASSNATAAFQVRFGTQNIVSGSLAAGQQTIFEGRIWYKNSTTCNGEWWFYSGISNAFLTSASTIVGFLSRTVNFGVDNLIDVRGNNVLTSNDNIVVSFFEVSHESTQ